MKKFSFIVATMVVAVATPAMSADLPVKAPAAPVIAVPFWTGFYLGGNVGYSWGRAKTDATIGGTAIADSVDVNGIIGGGQVGYNWQTGNYVLGIEADFQGSGQKGDGNIAALINVPNVGLSALTEVYEAKLTYFGTVRGRLGYAADRWLLYVTGGWAYGHEELNATATILGVAVPATYTTNRSGWTAGGGVEYGFDRHWSAKLEYLYMDLGDWNITASSGGLTSSSTIKFTDNILRLGVNYRF